MAAELAAVVRSAREKKKISQSALAQALGTSVGFVGKVERGQTGLKAQKLRPLCKALRIPLKTIVAAKVADYEAGVWATVKGK